MHAGKGILDSGCEFEAAQQEAAGGSRSAPASEPDTLPFRSPGTPADLYPPPKLCAPMLSLSANHPLQRDCFKGPFRSCFL